MAMFFLVVTGILLVVDLKQPKRFLYVLLRPQWQSWLVRGAYIITHRRRLLLRADALEREPEMGASALVARKSRQGFVEPGAQVER